MGSGASVENNNPPSGNPSAEAHGRTSQPTAATPEPPGTSGQGNNREASTVGQRNDREKSTIGQEKKKGSIITRQAERMGYPPPAPPHSTKADIFFLNDYSKIDEKSQKVPEKVLFGSYDDIATHLTKDLETELQRLRALFIWVTSLDIGSLEERLPKLPDAGTPCDYLLKIAWRLGNHAHFFTQLARAANLPCIVITGINKSAAYQLGQPMDKEAMGAQWNAVVIEGQWRLLDVFWASTALVGKKTKDWTLVADETTEPGSGDDGEDADDDGDGKSIHAINEFFFLPDPEQFVATHLPDDPVWQLMETPLSEEDFDSMVYIRERFYGLNLAKLPDSHPKHFLKTVKGQVCVKFGLDLKQTKSCQFRYLIFRSRQSGDKTTKTGFEKFVFYEKTDQVISYSAGFPVAGLFKMDIFGQNTKKHDTLDLVCSYLIKCDDPQQNVTALPINPEIGWGAGALQAEDIGLKAKSHENGIIHTSDGKVEIRFDQEKKLSVLQNLKHNQLDDWLLNRFAIVRTEGKELVINIRLPTAGEYALEMFADKEHTKGVLPNVCNYLIKCPQLSSKPPPFPKLHEGVLGKSENADDWGIRAVTHKEGKIEASESAIICDFECNDPEVEIFCELENNSTSSDELSKAVEKSIDGKKTNFNIDLPKAGEYGLNVYAKKKGQDQIRHVHSYFVISTQTTRTETQNSKEPPKIIPIITNKPNLDIKIPASDGELIGEITRKKAKADPSSTKFKSSHDGQNQVFTVKLPEEGEYKLDVFQGGAQNGLKQMAEYQIIYDKIYREPVPEEDSTTTDEEKEKMRQEKARAAKHKAQRDKLKAAMASQNIGLIQSAIQEFEKSGTPDDTGDLKKAKEMVVSLKLSQELSAAMASRNLERLGKAVAAVEKAGFQNKLKMQMAMAYRIIEQLRRIEKLRHAIMDLSQPTIAEIKSYATPPAVVHKVMTATFLLLGEREKHLRDWKACVVFIGKTGKQNLKRRVSHLKVEKLPIEVAMRAKDNLGKITLDDVRDVSNGAATFYVWSVGMIEECESRYTQNGGDLSVFQKPSKKK